MKLCNEKIKFLLTAVLFLGAFAFANSALGLELEYPELFGMDIGSGTFSEYIKYFFNLGVGISAILALIILTYGSITFLIDYGRGKILSEGKEWMKAGIFGLLLSISAYLIAFTINPNLVILNLEGVPLLSYVANFNTQENPSNVAFAIYNEIPIGSLTESLLSRTMDCYNYDDNGDPIDGEKIKTDDGQQIIGPTYLEHDRVDCVMKLGQAIENKAELVKQLSDKLVELMNQCNCALGGAASTGSGGVAVGPGAQDPYCMDKVCKVEHCTVSGRSCRDSCNSQCTCNGCDVCPKGVKDKIDHGPICITYLCNATQDYLNAYDQAHKNDDKEGCSALEKEFKGLDEFKSQYNNNYEAIKQVVEMQPPPKYNGKTISVIKTGNCDVCNITCPVCDPDANNYQTCESNRLKCVQNIFTCENKRKQCLMQNSPWYKLRLIDQLTYLKGKLGEIEQSVRIDLNNLTGAEDELGRCYLVDSYVDFLKTFEKTDEKITFISVNKKYTDQDTNKYVNPAKYCKGFQYDNSTCYSQCKKICPTNTKSIFGCMSGANMQSCSTITNESQRKTCISNQSKEYIKCVYKQSCEPGASSYSNFKECFNGCKQKCLDQCELLCEGQEKNACKNQCNANSQCLIDNAATCLVDIEGIIKCGTAYTDDDSLKKCSESAERCTYCSDQYSGYVDCVNSSAPSYTASYIYKNPNVQICKNPNEAIVISSTSPIPGVIQNGQKTATCVTLYPETQKCPASSKCPECPCGIVSAMTRQALSSATTSGSSSSGVVSGACQTTNPSAPGYCPGGGSCVNGVCTYSSSSSSGGTAPISQNSEYRVCSANCDDEYFKDDPLTFYCKSSWWTKDAANKESPTGEERLCLKSKEVPVGQTVDESEAWGQIFLQNIQNIASATQAMVSYMDKIGKEQNYCKCDSQCDYGPLCQSKCEYHEATVVDEETGEEEIIKWCTRSGCQGKPCQKIINMLSGGTGGNSKCASYPGIQYYLSQITAAVDAFYRFTVTTTRSDIVKMLNYSRTTTDTCSTTQNNYGESAQMLSCTRVEDEIISPIIDSDNTTKYNNQTTPSYCYGRELGKILGTANLMDNWFCCEQREQEKVLK